MKIICIYGEWSSKIHGRFDLAGLYRTQGLTGSESCFFNTARGLRARGHEVAAFCDCAEPTDVDGVAVLPLKALPGAPELGADAVISWNEPDLLRPFGPDGPLRCCAQQLNDFPYCQPGFEDHVDLWISPSANHIQNVIDKWIPAGKGRRCWAPNSTNLDLFADPAEVERNPHRAVWCSSPDRGLHHLLAFWTRVRAQVPDAELKIFYRVKVWIEQTRSHQTPNGRRARFIEEALRRLENHGVELCDVVPNLQMARELRAAAVLPYTCDPISYTEGFGVSVLDACAAGAVAIIPNVDALPSVHGAGAIVIDGPVSERYAAWVGAIALAMRGEHPKREAAALHAQRFDRGEAAKIWEARLREAIAARPTRITARIATLPGSLEAVDYHPDPHYPETPRPDHHHAWGPPLLYRAAPAKDVLAEFYENTSLHDRPRTLRFWASDRVLVGGAINDGADFLHLAMDFGITHVVSLDCDRSDAGKVPESMLTHLPTVDDGTMPPPKHWRALIDAAARCFAARGKLHVHCAMGQSRSPAAAFAVLRFACGWSFEEALEEIRRTYPRWAMPEMVYHRRYVVSAEAALSVAGPRDPAAEPGSGPASATPKIEKVVEPGETVDVDFSP